MKRPPLPTLAVLALFATLASFAAPAGAAPPAVPGGTRMAGEAVRPREFEFRTLPHAVPSEHLPVRDPHPEGVWEDAERTFERLKRNPKRLGLADLGNRLTVDTTPAAAGGEAGPLAPTLGTGFEGITQAGYIPGEPTVAAGPLNVFSAGNVNVTVTNKDGTNRVETSGATFFGVPAAEGAISDAQCYFDAMRQRFVALAFTQGTSPSNFSNFYLAISKTNDARGAWWLYKYDMAKDGSTPTTNWSDYESIGITDDKLVMTGQQFSFAANAYQYPKIRVLDRAALYAGTTSAYVDIVNFAAPAGGDGNDNFVTKCARNLSPDNVAHLMCVRTNGGSRVTYREITGTPAAPVLSSGNLVTVASYTVPPDAAQQGSSALVPTNDCRPGDFYWRNGVLVIAWHTGATISSTNVCALRLLRLRTSDRVALTDETFGAASTFYYYPAATVDSVGTVYLGFGRSSSSEYPSAYVTGRRRSDAAIEPSVLMKAGLSATAQSRWGDYTGIDNDASLSGPGGTSAWYAGQWTKGTNTFGTWVGKLSFGYGQVTGTVLADCDGAAGTTGDRSALAGVTVTLMQGAATIATTQSDATGAWSFGYLEAGTYDAIVTPPAGGSAVDAVAGSGGTSQTRVSASDVQVALTTTQTSAANTFVVATNHPAPVAASINPSTRNVGDPAFTLTVSGANFTSCSTVQFDGSPRTTTYLSANVLTASMPGADTGVPGPHSITVVTPSPGGGTSAALTLTVTGTPDTQAPVASLTSPAGGEGWAVGSAHNITWTATDDVGVTGVDLAWSSDGGTTFPNAIATGIANSGTYAWTVPGLVTATARVRVVAHDAGGNVGSDSSHANVAFTGWTITASAGAHGAIAPSGAVAVADGATPSFTITPASGYHVADVLVNGSSVGAVTSYPFPPVHADQTIAASFAIDEYALTVNVSGSGTVAKSPDQATYTAGSIVQLTATPAGGWNFVAWSGDVTGTTNPVNVTMDGNKTVTATFIQHTYTWNATGTAAFGTSSNWTPARTSPATDDVLVFSGGGSVVATGVTAQAIGRLVVQNSSTVALQAAAATTLTIGGATGTDLDVQAGSSLLLNGASAVTIALGSGATGNVAGAFVATTAAHRLTATDAGSLVFAAGGVATAGTGFSGNLFGTTSLNSVVFQSGALYTQVAGANPFGASAPNSVVVFQSGSRFRLDGALTPAMNGRTYADFEYNSSGTISPTGGTAVTLDSLVVTQGTFNLNLTGGAFIRGAIHVKAGATLGFNPASGTPSFAFSGTAPQEVDVQGTYASTTNTVITVNNAAGVTLASNWSVPGPLAFTSGRIATGARTLTIASTGSVTGAGAGTGWVNGNLRRTLPVNATTTFDVGDAATYAPVAVTQPAGGSAFEAVAFTATPDHPAFGTSDLNPLKSVNRWWSVAPVGSPSLSGLSAVFNFAASDLDAGANTANLLVRRYSGAAWSAPATGARTATSTQATGLSALGEFALGELQSWTITASAGPNGSIAPAGAVSVAPGGNQAFTITPDAGYGVLDVLVDAVSVGAVTSYPFTNVTADHTIAASFADTQAPSVTVLTPNGGESFTTGATASLTWTATDNGTIAGIDLLLSRDGVAGTYEAVATGIANTGSYDWTVTGPATSDAWLKVIAHDAAAHAGEDVSDAAFSITGTTAADGGTVTAFALSPVQPNPSHGGGRTTFALPRASGVRVSVLDVQGREVLVLADGAYGAGRHAVAFDGRTRLDAGLYFLRMRVSGGPTFTRRFAVTR